MNKEDLFEALLRVVGVVAFLYGLTYLLDGLLLRLGYFTYGDTTPAYFLIFGIGFCVVGAYLMRGAASVVRFAFPTYDDEFEEEENQQDPL